MSESVPPVSISNPLFHLHEQAEAEFQAYAQVQIVSTFGEPQAEYAAIRKSAALIDEPQRAILEVSGKDRFAFFRRECLAFRSRALRGSCAMNGEMTGPRRTCTSSRRCAES